MVLYRCKIDNQNERVKKMLVSSKTIKGLTVNSVTGQIKRFGKPVKVRTDSKYPYVTIKVDGHKRSFACHRLVVETLTNKPANSTIHHCNHDRNDYRPKNLAVVSRATHDLIESNGLQVEGNIF